MSENPRKQGVFFILSERSKLGQVVPDNFVVIHTQPIEVSGSFNTPFQPVRPFLVLEYVSKHNMRKNYEGSMLKYQDDLRVPYYLLFYPDNEELTVYRLRDDEYVAVKPNAHGRLAIPELDLEVALLDGWVRYWFRGELLPLPGELMEQLNQVRDQLNAEREARVAAESRAAAAEAELARLRQELARAKGQQA